VHLIAGRDQLTELLVAEPVEHEDAAQIFDEHQQNLPAAATAAHTARNRRPDRTPIAGHRTADLTTPRLPSPCAVEAINSPQVSAHRTGAVAARPVTGPGG